MLALEPGARQQLTQPAVARARGAADQQPRGLVTPGLAFDPAIGADNRLAPGRARRAIELRQAEEIAGVGERERRHVILGGAPHRVVDPDYAVAHRVLA